MTAELPPELDAFVRWLAMSPHKLEGFARDPEGFLVASNVGPDAAAAVRALGVEGVRRLVSEKSEAILSDTSELTYRRDETVQGFGARRPNSE